MRFWRLYNHCMLEMKLKRSGQVDSGERNLTNTNYDRLLLSIVYTSLKALKRIFVSLLAVPSKSWPTRNIVLLTDFVEEKVVVIHRGGCNNKVYYRLSHDVVTWDVDRDVSTAHC